MNISLTGLTKKQIRDQLEESGVVKDGLSMRADQIFRAIYIEGASDFDHVTSLSKPLRAALNERFTASRLKLVTEQKSTDGTVKWLLAADDGNLIETVYIPEEGRGTLCVSSQVGCALTCTFCHTGTQKLVRNLTAGEIIGQVLLAKDRLQEWGKSSDQRLLTNVVMMGMGEPLYNYENVRDALLLASDGNGLALGKRRITLSTAGVVPMIERLGDEVGCTLAISLHAVTDELRDILVPLNKKHPIKELMKACMYYPGLSNSRRITFEYVMLKGVNDSVAEAKALTRLLGGIPAKINLIPFNPWPGSEYECSDDAQIRKFADVVNMAGYASPVRTPRGRDILAACGQLKSASERKKRVEPTQAPLQPVLRSIEPLTMQ